MDIHSILDSSIYIRYTTIGGYVCKLSYKNGVIA